MSPRPGGESDKFGNRYEGAWTVRHLLFCLSGQGDSVTVEDANDAGQSAEFTFVRTGETQVHQVKRQNGNAASWTVNAINDHGIWQHIATHVHSGRQFHFVSMTPAPVLQDLADRARRAGSCSSFYERWLSSQDLKNAFTELSKQSILGSVERAWETLRAFEIRWPDERDLVDMNSALAGLLLDGADGRLASVGLGDIVINNLGVELTRERLIDLLPGYGLQPAQQSRLAALAQKVEVATTSWLFATGLVQLTPLIERGEVDTLLETATSGAQLKFVVGQAGAGKTSVVYQVVSRLRESGVPVLCFRLDRLESFSTTDELGTRLGLEGSPVAALAATSAGEESVLVVDQLDAVSLASGRMPNSFEAIANLVREAAAFPRMRILLVCRKFDVDNDHRIRGLSSRTDETVSVGDLALEQVDSAVDKMGVDSSALTNSQRSLLANTLNLALLSEIAADPNALSFESAGALFDLYWDRKRRDVNERRPAAIFDETVYVAAAEMSLRQRLSVPRSVLEGVSQADCDILISEHILVQDGREIAFFHEAIFDYVFARYWVSLNESLVSFLLQSEQELFRRAQVRQILNFLRDYDGVRFIREVDAVLRSGSVRYHIKQTVFAVLGQLSSPTNLEATTVTAIADTHPDFEARLWPILQTPGWFRRLCIDGYVRQWLDSDERLQSRAVGMLAGVARSAPDDVAAVVSDYTDHDRYAEWARRIFFAGSVEASRPLFDLLVNAVRDGIYSDNVQQLEGPCYRLAQQRSPWAIELLKAHFIDRHGAMNVGQNGQLEVLLTSSHGIAELIRIAAEISPKQFVREFVSYMRKVMVSAPNPADGDFTWPEDHHFSGRYDEEGQTDEVGEVLLSSMVDAMRALAATDAGSMREVLQSLAGDQHDSAQFLLYQSLIASGTYYADWAAELVLEAPQRLFCGYRESSVWVTRQLLQSISQSISDTAHQEIEDSVRDLRFPWETQRSGWYAFTLLSALSESRLSEAGRRRLGEYQRLFAMAEPAPPVGVVSGWIRPPIPREALEHMTDGNWLEAIRKHETDRTDWTKFTGGARELSSLLREETAKDPCRFARLSLNLTEDSHSSYGSAILTGFADAPAVDSPEPLFDAIRHIADIGEPDHDRLIGLSLSRYIDVAPIDLVERVLDRALNAPDPVDDRSIFDASSTRSASEQLHMTGDELRARRQRALARRSS